MEKQQMGTTAKQLNKFWRKVQYASKRTTDGKDRPVLGLIINQFRSKIGVMYGSPKTTPGGEGKNYHYATRIELKKSEYLKSGKGDSAVIIGQTIKANVVKNKTAVPNQVAVFDFYFADGNGFRAGEIDYMKELIMTAKLYKVITRAGAYYSYGGGRWLGEDATIAGIREDVDLREQLDRDVRAAVHASPTALENEESSSDEE
jgi:recombination protein RecA